MSSDKTKSPLFIALGDVHLSEQAPIIRSAEPDWYEAMGRQLRWLEELSNHYECPIVIAGDIFDRSTGSSRLINFALEYVPFGYSIAGNHDLPYHSLDKIGVSSYGAMMRANRLTHIDGVMTFSGGDEWTDVALHGFSFGVPLKPCKKAGDIDVAVVHHFVWAGANKPVGIEGGYHIDDVLEQLPGYDYYVFGDNHTPFIYSSPGKRNNVVNCGAFYRRKKGNETYQPYVYMVYTDHIESVKVPVSEDKFIERVDEKRKLLGRQYDFSAFFESLKQAEALTCDTRELLQTYLRSHRVDEDVLRAIDAITES